MDNNTHTATLTWPLATMNGTDGKKEIKIQRCDYGWTSGGLRWKPDGTAPQAKTETCWRPTYFGLLVDTIRPISEEARRSQLRAEIVAAGWWRTDAEYAKTKADLEAQRATNCHDDAVRRLAEFNKANPAAHKEPHD